MYIRVDRDGRVSLEDPANFRELKIKVEHPQAQPSSLQLWLKGVADPVGLDHAWISIDWLREHSLAEAAAASSAGFDAMIEFAQKQSWLNDQGTSVRSHVEWVAG
jgi:hypothetical protein